MRFYFTKRHEEALREEKIKPSLPKPLRTAILRILRDYSLYEDHWQSGSYNSTFLDTEETLKTFYGEDELRAYGEAGSLVSCDLSGVIKSGYPTRVLDAIEAWCDHAEPDKAVECERELNTIFEIHNSAWRIVNATVFLVDSEYLHNEVVAKTQMLLRENSVAGALEEFTEAVSCLTGGRTKDAVVNAHKSVESVMKTVLGTKRHPQFKTLLQNIIKSGIIPNYYEEFLEHFEKLALGVAIERNRPGSGHGQGVEPIEVPKSLAEFAVHLAATVNLFLIKRWLEFQSNQEEVTAEDDIPF